MRTRVNRMEDGGHEEVWVWEFRRPVDVFPRIASGDWLAGGSA